MRARCISSPQNVGRVAMKRSDPASIQRCRSTPTARMLRSDLLRALLEQRRRALRSPRRQASRSTKCAAMVVLPVPAVPDTRTARPALVTLAAQHLVELRHAGREPLVVGVVRELERGDGQHGMPSSSIRNGYSLVPWASRGISRSAAGAWRSGRARDGRAGSPQSETYSSRPWRVSVAVARSRR